MSVCGSCGGDGLAPGEECCKCGAFRSYDTERKGPLQQLDEAYAHGWNDAVDAATKPIEQAMANFFSVSKGDGGGNLCAAPIVAIRNLRKPE